ncbi:hypothetical protein MARBORIA2_06480 [Methanobrevibacter arboriphilus]|uniref:hypothetical protein n=1 Tax=Methanobrevibacter arboriphilus TaxID=39441 RepID=UPI0022EDF7CA|nr:hypothetical protein [Methanobrevibacter arboriphilus]GLI11558.1 hypothetical protein MARBORIA2_06480 [Methanobrevibacter arboriphilus]
MKLEGDQKLLIYAVGSLDTPLKSRIKLQKLFFLVSNVFEDINDAFRFEPHLFGPYSEILDETSEELIDLDLIKKNKNSPFLLTAKGKEEYEKLSPKKELKEVIDDFKNFLNDMSDDEVMTFIYAFYPDYISESTKWDKLKKKRSKIALNLLKKRKISFSKAVQLSELGYREFQDLANSEGIKWRS